MLVSILQLKGVWYQHAKNNMLLLFLCWLHFWMDLYGVSVWNGANILLYHCVKLQYCSIKTAKVAVFLVFWNFHIFRFLSFFLLERRNIRIENFKKLKIPQLSQFESYTIEISHRGTSGYGLSSVKITTWSIEFRYWFQDHEKRSETQISARSFCGRSSLMDKISDFF